MKIYGKCHGLSRVCTFARRHRQQQEKVAFLPRSRAPKNRKKPTDRGRLRAESVKGPPHNPALRNKGKKAVLFCRVLQRTKKLFPYDEDSLRKYFRPCRGQKKVALFEWRGGKKCLKRHFGSGRPRGVSFSGQF